MNSQKIISLIGAVVLTGLGASNAAQAAGANSIKFGAIVNPTGQIALVEYEHIFAERVSIGARVGAITYDYEDDTYEEEGQATGAEFIARFYPKGAGFDGFYVGGGVGIWSGSYDWVDPQDSPVAGDGTSTALDVNVNLGWKIPLGTDKVYIDPSVNIGNFISIDSDDESNLGFYLGAGVAVGFVF